MALQWYSTVVNAREPRRLAAFWAQVLGWAVAYKRPDDVAIEALDIPDDRIPAIIFVRNAAEPKTRKNRLHFDLRPAD
jgi:hypothetical protein